MCELVVIYTSGPSDVFEYRTEEEAQTAGDGMKKALGNQIVWYGTRKRSALLDCVAQWDRAIEKRGYIN